jgi:hypothetical protein
MKNYHEIIESEVWKDYACTLSYPVSHKQSLARFNIGRLKMALMQRFGMKKLTGVSGLATTQPKRSRY